MADSLIPQLQRCIDRLLAGDESARNDLLNHASEALLHLTRKMLKDYSRVRRWEETGDVAQNAGLRLWRTLQAVKPTSVRDFFRLAALQTRRELIDLARHYYGPQGAGAQHASQDQQDLAASTPQPAYEQPDGTHDPSQLVAWTEFHKQVEILPDEEREVFDLLWYQGLKQAEAAELLGVDERTVKRRWQGARLKVSEALHGQSPAL